jgi:hypothetical protein
VGTFEYLLLFAAVILGLAISDLAVSLHRLLNAAQRVRWDALSLLAAALAFERIVIQWWTWHAADRIATGLTFGMFLGILISTVLLFLMAAVALPDETGDDIDLRVYYARVHRRYWLLFAAQWVTLNIVSAWAQHTIYKERIDLVSPLWLIVPVTFALAFISNRIVQALGLMGFMVFYTSILFGQTLS